MKSNTKTKYALVGAGLYVAALGFITVAQIRQSGALKQELKDLGTTIEDANTQRTQEIKDCVEGVVEVGMVGLQYPSQPLCNPPDLTYWRLCDAHLSSITEIDNAYRTGKVPVNPEYATRDALIEAASLGTKAREQAERVCTGKRP